MIAAAVQYGANIIRLVAGARADSRQPGLLEALACLAAANGFRVCPAGQPDHPGGTAVV